MMLFTLSLSVQSFKVDKDIHYRTKIYTTVQGYTLLYKDIHYCTRIYTTVQRYTLLYKDIHYCTKVCDDV